MLVLSRKINQTVMVGDEISVTIISISSDKVRLGFEAPADVPVHRLEIWEALKRQARRFVTGGIKRGLTRRKIPADEGLMDSGEAV